MLTPPPPLLLLPWKISYCEFGWIESGETLVLMHDCTWNIQDSISYFWNSAQSLFPFANFFHLRFKMYFHWNFILFFTHFIVFLLNIIWSNIAHVTCLQELEMFRWPELLTTQVPKPAIFFTNFVFWGFCFWEDHCVGSPCIYCPKMTFKFSVFIWQPKYSKLDLSKLQET